MALDMASWQLGLRRYAGFERYGSTVAIDRRADRGHYLWQGASLPQHPDPGKTVKTITGATKANPCVVTATSHGFSTGDIIYIKSVGGMTELNENWYIITKVDSNSFKLRDTTGNNVNSSTYGTYTSGGTVEDTLTVRENYYGQFNGMCFGIKWREIEVAPGIYDFKKLQGLLDVCAARRVLCGLYFEWKHFDTSKYRDVVPSFYTAITNSAGKTGAQVTLSGQDGAHAMIWDQIVNSKIRQCLEAVIRRFSHHPWFAGIEFAETAGVSTATGANVTVNGTSLTGGTSWSVKWDDATATFVKVWTGAGDGNTFANTTTAAQEYEYAYGRMLRDMARKKSGLMIIGGTNLFPVRNGSAEATGFQNVFAPDGDEFAALPNLASGGHDILFEQPAKTGLNVNSYPVYSYTTNAFFKHKKKCAMQHDSHKVSENGGMHPARLWQWARDNMGLSLIQWNYEQYYTYVYSDSLLAILADTTCTPVTYVHPDFKPQVFTTNASRSTAGVFTTGTTTEDDSYTLAIQCSITASPVTGDQVHYQSIKANGDYTKIYTPTGTSNLTAEVKNGATITQAQITAMTWPANYSTYVLFKHCCIENRIYLFCLQKGGNPVTATGATKVIGDTFQFAVGNQTALGSLGALVYQRGAAGGRQASAGYKDREFQYLRPNSVFTTP